MPGEGGDAVWGPEEAVAEAKGTGLGTRVPQLFEVKRYACQRPTPKDHYNGPVRMEGLQSREDGF